MDTPRREPSLLAEAREALLVWFHTTGPVYPWRETERDPYAVLVSEVMLQQTQASRVVEVFPPFLRRFPDVVTLANAGRADVIRAWSGLGYNRRAVALHRAAREIVADHGGVVPVDPAVLRELPGVGPYTAAAVASIAHGVPVAAIDTNVRKVIARAAFGVEPDEVGAADLARAAAMWLAPDAPGAWNQAVMNLGRQVCRPVPRCDACPLSTACRFRLSGRPGRGSGRRQPAFEGSTRQLRGGIIRELTARSQAIPVGVLATALGQPTRRVRTGADALAGEGLIERTPSGRLRLPR